MLKSELRQQMKVLKRQFTSNQLREQSLVLVNKVLRHPRVNAAQTILLYYSMADEVDTHNLVDLLREQGKTVLLPVTLAHELEIRRYEGPKSLQEGRAFHIMEPTGAVFTQLHTIDLVIVPGMGFDPQGNRLGRGKGYYDRFLRLVPQAYKLGLCFDFQKVASVPTEDTDVRMDEII